MVFANAEVHKVTSSLKRKRRNYNNYDSEQRAKIARYAIEHRVARAARHFTGKLGTKINESMVRSLKKKLFYKCQSVNLALQVMILIRVVIKFDM